MKIGYICENCNTANPLKSWVFDCVECEKEICENCMYGLATCKECAKDKSESFLISRFENING